MSEASIQAQILLTLGARPELCRIHRRNRGTAVNLQTGRGVQFGDFPGAADITGILVDGRRLEIEVKGPKGRLTPEQRSFGEMIQRYRGVWLVARSVEEAVQAVEAAVRVGA